MSTETDRSQAFLRHIAEESEEPCPGSASQLALNWNERPFI